MVFEVVVEVSTGNTCEDKSVPRDILQMKAAALVHLFRT